MALSSGSDKDMSTNCCAPQCSSVHLQMGRGVALKKKGEQTVGWRQEQLEKEGGKSDPYVENGGRAKIGDVDIAKMYQYAHQMHHGGTDTVTHARASTNE
eukprot:6182157-Pleurochrysis_carterae.AAC.2